MFTINHVFITMNPATINHIITMEPTILPIALSIRIRIQFSAMTEDIKKCIH